MYNIIPIILISVCLIIILAIIVRKFPQLAILDVENMPEEKEGKVKEQIIKNRLNRDLTKWNAGILETWKFISKKISFLLSWLNKLRALREKYHQEKQLSEITQEEKIELLISQARELMKKDNSDDFAEAEKKLIEVVSLDKKCLPAFLELAEVYSELKKYLEAKQTYLYCLRLLEFKDDKKQEAEINYLLSLVNKNLDSLDEAQENIIESLKIEPNNPRFLDTLLDLCVLRRDNELAQATLKRLAEVNPENQKLGEWQEKINNLPL